jgi:hypothetical protein
MAKSYPEVAHCNHFLVRMVRIFKVTLDNVQICGDCSQVVYRVPSAQVACAKNVLDLAWHQELLEFGRHGIRSVRDVEITDDKHKLWCGREEQE